jgi:hypothetical protein
METLLIDILKSGSIAFFGSKITKSLQQKEISEILEASGWCIVGIDVVKIIVPILRNIKGFFADVNGFFDNCNKFMNGVKGFFG